jgi:hypothetical protein
MLYSESQRGSARAVHMSSTPNKRENIVYRAQFPLLTAIKPLDYDIQTSFHKGVTQKD